MTCGQGQVKSGVGGEKLYGRNGMFLRKSEVMGKISEMVLILSILIMAVGKE